MNNYTDSRKFNNSNLKSEESMGSIFADEDVSCKRVLHRRRKLLGNIYPFALFAFDVMLIVAIFTAAIYFRYDMDIVNSISRRILLVILTGSIMGVALIGGYNYQTNKHSFRFISEHLIVSIFVFIGVFFIIYSIVAYGVKLNSARSVITFTLVAFPVVSISYRFILSKIKSQYQKGNAICIIGSGWEANDLWKRLKNRNSTLEVIIVDPDPSKVGQLLTTDNATSPKIKSIKQVSFNSSMNNKYVESYVLACDKEELPKRFLKKLAAAQFRGNAVFSYDSYLTEKLMIIPPSKISMDWVLSDGFRLNKNPTYDRLKRLFDIVFSLLGMIALSPVFLITAIAVKLTSKGPVIFKQIRVGHHENPFMLYKFRSMNVGSENGAKYTAANDSRLTPVGKFLRKSRLDELPQFFNVFIGDLSIIGPRAEWIELVKGYEKKFPFYNFRHAIKPGITGWAQVNYSYGQNDEDTLEKLNYDFYYIRRYTPLLDVIIIVKTLYMVVFGRGQ
ncbi:MAG: exopolysaccharide biosynthesis polyprenyl glycosylphosphotransferase [Rubritalea sp.]|jgi:exopolysaccharide biosynthesis polyprenyl glycosylphosphotransferase|tara:strand:- start:2202 stop:3710 length:1509 start_codon:yes stop_codon:yes gene_type:complete